SVRRHHRAPLQAAEGRARERQFAVGAHVAHDREPGPAAVTRQRQQETTRMPRNHEITKKKLMVSCFRGFVASACAAIVGATLLNAQGKPVTYKGLEMSVAGVERAPTASLKDCPPGG